MADSLTPFLGLTKPVVNDPDGEDLWGEKLNANFDKLDAFALGAAPLPEPPQDNKVYGRGTPQAWIETIQRAEFTSLATDVATNTSDITALEGANAAQDTAINGKAPLGPNDGQVYGWKGTTWFNITTSLTVDWGSITGKPTTFPPTLPIPSSGVTGLDAKQASQDTAIAAINWSSLSGKPATFPPSTHSHSISEVTSLQAALDAKEPVITAGNPAYFWAGDKTWKPVPAAGIAEAPTDGQLYSRKGSNASWVVASAGAVVADTPPIGMPVSTIWWNSASGGLFIDYQDPNTRQWVMVNAAGMPEAPLDGFGYLRASGAWQSGGTLNGTLTVNGQLIMGVSAAGYLANVSNTSTANNTGGVIGQAANGAVYGILGYKDVGGSLYSFYGSGLVYSASGSFTGNLSVGGTMNVVGTVTFQAALVVDGIGTAYALQTNPSAAGAGGGIIGFGSTGSIYAISGYGGYSLYTSGPHSFGGDINVSGALVTSGLITSSAGGSDVQTTSANTVMTTNGTLRRTTSSLAYKTDIELLQDPWADKVLELRPIYYRPTGTSDPEGYTRYGFGAEDCYAVDPRFSISEPQKLTGYETIKEQAPNPAWGDWQINKEGEAPPVTIEVERQGAPIYEDRIDINGVDLNAVVAALQQVIKRQDARIAALEAARV